jgi:hypothetical protein
MNKKYIANENHPELKAGVKVFNGDNFGGFETQNSIIITAKCPLVKPDWYDEVKEEPTVSEKEIEDVMDDICIQMADGHISFDIHRLSTYLAKLEKRIKAYKGE